MKEAAAHIDSHTKLYGVLGHPVGHSLSPLIHNALFRSRHMNAVYLAFDVDKDALPLAFEGIRSLNVRGVNLTLPFKEEATGLVDEIPEDVDRCIGAINTIVNKDGMLYGYNTDVPGFLTALKEDLGFDPEGRKVLVLGAGGAARGAAFALASAHADRVWVHNRTHDRAHGLVEYLSQFFPDTDIEAIASTDTGRDKPDLVVNATSLGLKSGDGSPFDFQAVDHKMAAYDLIYKPAETAFLKQAKARGFAAANGLGMLAAQAALSSALWTGHSEGVRELMLETLKTCSL